MDPLERLRGKAPQPGGQRPLTVLEKGVEVAALNLIRNYLSGEMEYGVQPEWWDESLGEPDAEVQGGAAEASDSSGTA